MYTVSGIRFLNTMFPPSYHFVKYSYWSLSDCDPFYDTVPWVTVLVGEWAEVWIITRIAVVLAISSIVIMIIGGIMQRNIQIVGQILQAS